MDDNGSSREADSLWAEGNGGAVPLLSHGSAAAVAETVAPNGDEPSRTGTQRGGEPLSGSAADFSAERMLRPGAEPPTSGWRRLLFQATGGLVRLAPSAAEFRHRELVARVKTPVRGCRKVAFISRKGGVGKTTTCLLAGHTFAAYRGDRVIALDGNPDAGTLGHRVRRETAATVTTLLSRTDEIQRYSDIRAFTSQAPTRLEVVAADDDPQITQALGHEDFRRTVELLEHHYNLICLDTGTGVLESATRGILDAADQIVVVIAPSLDGARAASSTLDWLGQNGYERLVAGAVGVVNGIRTGNGPVDVDRVEEHFAGRCRTTVRIPWDAHLEAGAEAVVEELAPTTRHAYLELAAAIAAGFAEPPERRP
jgi:putative peptide zinc metalloprotease protein